MILIILLAALLVRLISLNQSLWWDEAINIVYSKQSSFWEFVTQYPMADFHPPGWFGLLWIWMHFLGVNEMTIRLLPVLIGVATVFVVNLIGKELSKKIGILAACLLSSAPLHIYYSQEVRPYAFAALAVSLSFLFFIRLLNNKPFAVIGYAISIALVLYSDYVAYFVLPVQLIYVLVYRREIIKIFFRSFLFGVLFIIPWAFLFPAQLIQGQQTASVLTGWKEVVGGAKFKELILLGVKTLIGKVSFENNVIYGAVVSIVSIPFLLSLNLIKKHKVEKNIFLFWLVLPVLFGFVTSLILPIFAYFRFLYILPAFYLLVAFGLSSLDKKKMYSLLLPILIVHTFFSFVYLLNPRFQREDWRGAVEFINVNQKGGSVFIFENNVIPSPVIYYSDSLNGLKPGLKNVPARSNADVNFSSETAENSINIFLFEYLVDVTDPQRLLEKQILNLGYKRVDTKDYRGVGFIHVYEK